MVKCICKLTVNLRLLFEEEDEIHMYLFDASCVDFCPPEYRDDNLQEQLGNDYEGRDLGSLS